MVLTNNGNNISTIINSDGEVVFNKVSRLANGEMHKYKIFIGTKEVKSSIIMVEASKANSKIIYLYNKPTPVTLIIKPIITKLPDIGLNHSAMGKDAGIIGLLSIFGLSLLVFKRKNRSKYLD